MSASPGARLAGDVEALLCDADGNLFPSEVPAFEASATVTNRLLADIGVARTFEPAELRLATTGLNFRTTAARLAAEAGVDLTDSQLELWVAEEKLVVSQHLRRVLRPDPAVTTPLARLSARVTLAVVTSSALSRIDTCLRASGLADLFPASRRYSAEDSLIEPTSKPDPAIYLHSLNAIGVAPERALAVEDSVPGAVSAVAAGIPTVGNLVFVPADERAERADELIEVGVATVVSSWGELESLLAPDPELATVAG